MKFVSASILSIKIYVSEHVVALSCSCIMCAAALIAHKLPPILVPYIFDLFGNKPITNSPLLQFFSCPNGSFISCNHTLAHYKYARLRPSILRPSVRQQTDLLSAEAGSVRNNYMAIRKDWANQTVRENGAVARPTYSNRNPLVTARIWELYGQHPDNIQFRDRMTLALADVRHECAVRDFNQLILNHYAFDGIESYRERVSPDYREYKTNQRAFLSTRGR